MWNKFGVPEIGTNTDCYQEQIKKAVEEHDRLQAALDGIPLDRLEAICNAERDGRCYTPPVKIGDTVYWRSRFGNAIHQGKVYEIKISSFGFDLELRTAENQRFLRESEKCYFTRKAAEAALKEREKNDRN